MKIKFPFAFLLLSVAAFGQQNPIQIDANGLTQTLTAGGLVNRGQIVKINSAGQVVPVLTTDTSGAIGVAATSQTSAGNGVSVSIQGTPLVQIDANGCTAGNFVAISTTTAGAGHCSSTSGSGQIGVALSISSPGSNFWNVQLSPLSAAGASGLGLGPLAFTCTSCNPNWQYAFNVTCNNLSAVISTGANDPPFTAADVNKIVVGSAAGASAAANCPPQGTISAFTDAHHITVSNAATATTITGNMGWGTQDDGANLRNAFLASLGKGCLILPAGGMAAGIAGSDSVNLFIDNRTSSATGTPPCVIGQGNTIITPLPAFNYANCVSNDACIYKFSQALNANPNYGLIKDWEWLLLGYGLTGTGTTNQWINWQRTTIENVWLWSNFDLAAVGNGFGGAGPTSVFSPIVFKAANNGCVASGTGGSSAGLNQIVTMQQGFCQGHSFSLSVASGAALKTSFMQFGGNSTGNEISTAGIWDSWGDGFPAGAADTIRIGGGITSLHNDWVVAASANTLGAIDCNASGATVLIDGGAVDGGGGGGFALRSVAGCNIKVRFPVQALNYAASLAGNNVSDPSETQTGACTTNAATVTFKLTYAVAPLVLVSDTTSASTGAQATATNLTTATIHCNGASDTFVATVIPNPI